MIDIATLISSLEKPIRTTTMLERFVDRFEEGVERKTNAVDITKIDYPDPADWIEKNIYVDRPRDPITGELLPTGPVRLAEYQKEVLRMALGRENGKLNFSTVVWSEPKKSGKTAVAAAVGLYAAFHTPNVHIYCLANDGKQSKDRIFGAMDMCIQLHKKVGGAMENVQITVSPPMIKFPNGTIIEAIPCDAAGEAGAEPFLTIWSELWGYRQAQKEKLWTEMTIPPTLWGYAMRWVESYAGYEGESSTLWQLYEAGVMNGAQVHTDLPVYVTQASNQFTFWSHEHRQPWQTKEYYASEAALLTVNEFDRIHNNNWTSSAASLVSDISLWDRLEDAEASRMPTDDTPVVIALDASVTNDYSALVVVKRHPADTWDSSIRRACVCGVWTFLPPKGGKIDQSATFQPVLYELCEKLNVVAVVYDPYQLEKLAKDMAVEGVAPFIAFNQASRRTVADKQFHDMLHSKQIYHNGNLDLRRAVQNCATKEEGDKKMRLVKKGPTKKIDEAVATSMAVDELLRLNL